jgi:hypothetical protein
MHLNCIVDSHPIVMPNKARDRIMSMTIVENKGSISHQHTRTPFFRYTARNDSKCADYDSCSTEAGYSTPDYQHRRGDCRPAKQRTKLEDTKEGEKSPLFPDQERSLSKVSACDIPLCQRGCISFPSEVEGPHWCYVKTSTPILPNWIPSLPTKLISAGVPTDIRK